MMYILMLPCYLIVMGAFVYCMSSLEKPNGYLLLGVKLPKEEMNREEIQAMVKQYKKRKKFLVFFMLITTFLPFFIRKYPIISTIYCLAIIFVWLGIMYLIISKTFDEIYTYKKEQGWIVGETYTISIDTEVTRLKTHFLYSKWHWIIILILTVIGCLLWRTKDSGGVDLIYMLANCFISLTLLGIYIVVPKVKSTVYSDNSEINVALNRCYCYELTKAMVLASYVNAIGWLIGGFFKEPVYNYVVILAIVMVTSILTCLIIFRAIHKVRKERNLLTTTDEPSYVADDDIYWRGGIYKNPNDPKLWVEKRLGFGMTINMAHTSGKVIGLIVTAIIVGCFALLIYFIPLDFPSLSLTMDDNQIYIHATQYDTKINFDDITEVKIITELPKLYKNNGLEDDTYDIGKFRAKEYGQSKVYINKKQAKKYLLIYTEDNIYFINSDKEEELEDCISELQLRDLLN